MGNPIEDTVGTHGTCYALSQQSHLPWFVIGDMNNILSHDDKRGGRRYPEWLVQGFNDTTSFCNLIDVDLVGH